MTKKTSFLASLYLLLLPVLANGKEQFLPEIVKDWTVPGNIIVTTIVRSELGRDGYLDNDWPMQFVDCCRTVKKTDWPILIRCKEPEKTDPTPVAFHALDCFSSITYFIRVKDGSGFCPCFFTRSGEPLSRSDTGVYWVLSRNGKIMEICTKSFKQSDILLLGDKAKPADKDIWHVEYNKYGAPAQIRKGQVLYEFDWDGNEVAVTVRMPNFVSIKKYVYADDYTAEEWDQMREYRFDAIENDYLLSREWRREKKSPAVEKEKAKVDIGLVETKPTFMGGDANTFAKWVNSKLRYPAIAKGNGVQGRVLLHFTVDETGVVRDVKVLRGVDPELDREAVRVISSSPKWMPGKTRDEPVPVTYLFPVTFGLK